MTQEEAKDHVGEVLETFAKSDQGNSLTLILSVLKDVALKDVDNEDHTTVKHELKKALYSRVGLIIDGRLP